MEDITKTGIQGLKGLSHGGQSNLSMDELIELDRANRQQGTGPEQVASRFNVQGVQDIGNQLILAGYGDSSYDEGITMSLLDDLLDIRAERQPWYSQIANGLAKGALLAGTTFLDGTLGLLFGSVAAINEGRWSALWDNDFSRAMLSLNEKSEELLPNYYSEAELTEPWYENIFTANFLGDKFIKNLGFTVGAFYSGGLEAGAMRGLGRLAMGTAKNLGASISTIKKVGNVSSHVASAVGAVTSAVNEGRIEALNNSKDWYEATLAPIQDDYKARRAALEELGDYDSIAELDSNYEETLATLNEDRMKMGNADLIMNIPILTASNLILFGKVYANGFRTGRRANNIVGNITEGYRGATTRATGIRKAILNPLSEGTEEISQGMASRISGDYYQTDVNNFYKAKTDPDAQQETLSWWKSFAQGINETVNDGSAWEEFFIGTLTGAMGMPRFRGTRNEQGKFQSPVTLEGGILGELRENREQIAREQEITDYMNNRLQSPEFRNYYQGLSRHNYYLAAMDQAIQNDDEFEFKNAEQAQFISDVSMFDAAGKIEDLTTLINSAYDTSDENLESIARNTTSVVTTEQLAQQINATIQELDMMALEALEEGNQEAVDLLTDLINALQDKAQNLKDIHVGPFVDQDGNPLYATEQGKEEMINKLTKTKDEMLGQIDDYVKAKIDLQGRLPEGIGNDLLEELIFLQTQVNNWDKRGEEMTPIIKNTINEASNSLRTLASASELGGNIELSEDYNSSAEFLEKLVNDRTPKQLMQILSHPENSKLTSQVANIIGAYGNNVISNLDKLNVVRMLDDIIKIGKSKELYQKRLEEYIANPQAQVVALTQAREEQENTRSTSEAISTVDKINNSSVSDIVQEFEEEGIDFDALDDFFESEEDNDARDKVDAARQVIDTDKRTRDELNNMASQGEISEQELNDVLSLLDNSKAVAESSEELLDLDTEAFNDPHALDDLDARETVELAAEKDGLSLDEARQQYNDLMSQRIDAAKNIVSTIKSKFALTDAELSEVPSASPAPITDTTPDTLTGHDSVDKNEPVNTPSASQSSPSQLNRELTDKTLTKYGHSREQSPDLAKDFDNIYSYVDRGLAKGVSDKDILDAIAKTDTYKRLEGLQYSIKSLVQRALDLKKQGTTETLPQAAQRTPEIVDLTPDTSMSLDNEIEGENKRDNTNYATEAASEVAQREGTSISTGRVGGTYDYWRPSTTELPIHRQRGDNTPYWQTVTTSARDRYQATYEYLKHNGTFSRVNNNQVKKGDEVHFGISKGLSEKAGKPIILLLNSNNEVIGDLPMPEDASFGSYVGLSQLYEGANKWYQENRDTLHENGNDIAVIPGYKSNVARNMVGKPQYTSLDERHTLNQINTITTSDGSAKQVPFRLGIAIANADSNRVRIMSDPGRSKSLGVSPLERTIIAPLRSVKGQPFLLMPTSSSTKAFVSVPIMMPRFDVNNPTTANSKLGLIISQKVLELSTIPNNTDLIMKWIDEMQELLAIPEIHVNFTNPTFTPLGRKPQELVVAIKRPGETKQTVIFKGQQANAPTAVLNGLSGSMFQVSRKYINDTYNGQSYNEMIGELAETNLPIGATHTINDWFTIDPIVDRKQQKAHSPKSTKTNPTLTLGNVVRFRDTAGNNYYMANSNRLYKENPEGNDTELLGDKYNYLKAHAYGARIGESLTKPYDTPWGYYNPVSGKFEAKPSKDSSLSYTEDTVGGSPVALSYLLENGVGTIESLGYFLHGVSAAFPTITSQLEGIRSSHKGILGLNPNTIKTHKGLVLQLTEAVLAAYGKEGVDILNTLIDNSTGFVPKEGSQIEKRIEALKPVSNSTKQETAPNQVTRAEALGILKKRGLLNKKERNVALDKLTDSRIFEVAEMSKLKARHTLEKFDAKVKANMDADEINKIFDDITGYRSPFNREVTRLMAELKSWTRESEVEKMTKVLPQLSEDGRVRVVDGLIRIARSGDPAYAWGQFQNGVITLSDRAARGTMYHESFHFVTLALLSQKELNDLYSSAEKQYGKLKRLELEEKLAEDFREFMQSYEDDGVFKNIFKTLKHIIKSLLGKETITNKLFHDIRRGNLASRSVGTSNNTLYRKDPMTLTLELNELRRLYSVSHSKRFQDEVKRFNGKVNRNWDAAHSIIDRYGLRDVAYVFEGQYGAAKIGVQSLKEFTKQADRLKGLIKDAYESELSDDERLSNWALEQQETYYREIEQYYREKLDYGRLNQEQKDYINERGLTLNEYNSMTPLEKEVLFRCMY